MSIDTAATYEIDIEDVEYLRYGDKPLLARLFKPRGEGPFPALVEIHGGAWYTKDRMFKSAIKEHLAKMGILVVAVDFRMPPSDPYPAALADVNYAIRWVKAHASELHTAPELVGVIGSSSGGHQSVLAAMRPFDARYTATPSFPVDPGNSTRATVRCAIALWPVISPLGRYHYAQDLASRGENPELTDSVLPGHEQFWLTEEAMAEGDPGLSLERGEPAELPPVLIVQSPTDPAHPFAQLERFAALYREAGGQVDLELPDVSETPNISVTLNTQPTSPTSLRVYGRIAELIEKATA